MKRRRRTKKRIQVQPLLDAIEQRGGLGEVLTRAGVEVIVPGTTKTPTLAYQRQEKRLRDADAQGWIDYFIADEIAIEVLGMHPYMIWGDHWFTAPDDNELQDALFGRPMEVAA